MTTIIRLVAAYLVFVGVIFAFDALNRTSFKWWHLPVALALIVSALIAISVNLSPNRPWHHGIW